MLEALRDAPSVVITLLLVRTQDLRKASLFGSQSEDGKSLLQGLEAAGHVVSTSRKQRATDARTHPIYLFLSFWCLEFTGISSNLMQIPLT